MWLCSPVHWFVCVQQFEDGLAVHLCRDVHSCHVQQGGRHVDIQHNVRVTGEEEQRKVKPKIDCFTQKT